MKTTTSIACLVLLGAQAIRVDQTKPTGTQTSKDLQEDYEMQMGNEAAEADDDTVLTTYIGFEFEGADLAHRFSALDNEQQNEVRLLVQDLINDYWTDAGEPMPDEDTWQGDKLEGEDEKPKSLA